METKTKLSKTVSELQLKKEGLEADINNLSSKMNALYSFILSGIDKDAEIKRVEEKLYAHYRKLTLTEQEVADYIGINRNHLKELFSRNCVPFSFIYFPSSDSGDYNVVTIESMAKFIVEHTINC